MDSPSRLLKHIAIVTALDDLSTSPSILNAVHLLVEAGYQVDIIARGHHCSMPNDEGWKNGVHFHLSPWSVRKGIPGLVALRHLLLIIKKLCTLHPIAVIAISPDALVLAGPVAVLLGLPLIHFCLEIRFPIDWISRTQKEIEKFIYCFVQFTIIQDKVRAKTLLDSNGMSDADMIFVPNSSGLAESKVAYSTYLRDRWKISPYETVILFAGQISPMTMCLELAQVSKTWPQYWRLIIHGWSIDPLYMEKMRAECDGFKVILSEETVPYERLDELVSSADIGIALYSPRDQNVQDMGCASGKIWQYLRCGLPVVTVDFPSLIQMVNDGQFGLCVHHLSELKSVIEQLISDKINFSNRAKDYYLRHGDFAMNFKPVLERLAEL
jgi:glycosyltransferase involved in cell wall biosynthesis